MSLRTPPSPPFPSLRRRAARERELGLGKQAAHELAHLVLEFSSLRRPCSSKRSIAWPSATSSTLG